MQNSVSLGGGCFTIEMYGVVMGRKDLSRIDSVIEEFNVILNFTFSSY